MERVLEVGGSAAGYCGRLFVQAGYDVVRIEDGTAAKGWVSDAALETFLHAGKRRVQAADVPALVNKLAATADIVIIEADSADAADAFDIDDWAQGEQRTVTAVITPFGRTGPKRNWHATPNVLLAMSGYSYIMGDAERAPLTLPGHYVEFQSAQYAFTAAMASRLAHASHAIDIAMLEVLMSLSQFTTVLWHCAGNIRSRHGSDFWFIAPSDLFRCADGWAYLNIVPTFWDAFLIFLDRPDLALDERFTTNDQRKVYRDELHDIIQQTLEALPKTEVRQRADAARIPLGIVQTFDDVLADEHLAERKFWQTVTATDGSEYQVPGAPFHINNALPPPLKVSEPVAMNDASGVNEEVWTNA